MADFAKLARALGDVSGVKGFLFATEEGSPADCMEVADPEHLASSLTLMLMHAAPAAEALGLQGFRCMRVGAKNREDLLVFRVESSTLGVIKEAGASGSGIMAAVGGVIGGREGKGVR